MISECLQLRVD